MMSANALIGIVAVLSVTAGVGCHALGLTGRLERGVEYGSALCTVTNASVSIGYGLRSDYGPALLSGFAAAICAYSWWDQHKKNRHRRRVLAMLGAKSRALRDALVRRMRELKPRPVLRPSPVPA